MIVCRVFWKYAVKHRSGKVVDKINELLNASSWKGKTIGTKCLVRSVGFSRKYGFILCQGFLEMELQQMGGGLERGRKCLGDRRATIQNSPKHLEYRMLLFLPVAGSGMARVRVLVGFCWYGRVEVGLILILILYVLYRTYYTVL